VEFFREGEWDNSNTLLGLTLVRKDACYAWLQVVKSKVSVGLGPRQSPLSVASCAVVGCTIVGHQPENKKVPPEERHEGWFLQVGNANQGVIKHMWFPLR